MRVHATAIPDVRLIDLAPWCDERGQFVRTFCRRTFEEHGLPGCFEQCNFVTTDKAGTLRGMHYQVAPAAEAKVVHCVRGSLFDVVLDLRRGSPAYRRWAAFRLDSARPQLLFVPAGCAHGYQTLVPETSVYYFMSTAHAPDAERGVRWDDPAFAIAWPIRQPFLSDKDRNWPDFAD